MSAAAWQHAAPARSQPTRCARLPRPRSFARDGMRIEEITGWMDRVYEINATGSAMTGCSTYFCGLGVSAGCPVGCQSRHGCHQQRSRPHSLCRPRRAAAAPPAHSCKRARPLIGASRPWCHPRSPCQGNPDARLPAPITTSQMCAWDVQPPDTTCGAVQCGWRYHCGHSSVLANNWCASTCGRCPAVSGGAAGRRASGA